MIKKIASFLYFLPLISFSQGIVNNGATIYLDGGVKLVVDGTAANANYTNMGTAGELKSGSASDELILDGDFILDDDATIDNFNGTITVSGGEWTNNSTTTGFVTNHGTVVMSGTNVTFGGTATTSAFNNLTLSNSGTVTLNTNLHTGGGDPASLGTGVFSLGSKAIPLGGKTLTINNKSTGAVTRTTGYIVSETETGNPATNASIIYWKVSDGTGSYVYPLAYDASNYIPFTFNITAAGSADAQIGVATRANSGGSDNSPWSAGTGAGAVDHMSGYASWRGTATEDVIDRWWEIWASGTSNPTASMTFSYRGSENTCTSPTDVFTAQRWNGADWDYPLPSGSSAGVTSGIGTVTVTGVSSFSPWVLVRRAKPLPVTLLSFTAKCTEKGDALLEWITASEQNNSHFIIEKSYDGKSFAFFAKTPGSGNSSVTNKYELIDMDVMPGEVYYMLRQIDFDGKEDTLNVISFQSNCENGSNNNSTTDFSIYPNPSNGGTFNVTLNGIEHDSEVELQLLDATAREICSKKFINDNDQSTFVIEPSSMLARGVYFVTATAGQKTFRKKLIVW